MKTSPKKFVFVTRMYSGLFESFKEHKWMPTGIPTIVKLADSLSKDYRFKWIIVCKTKQETDIVRNTFSKFKFGNLNISVIPFRQYSRIGRFNYFFNDIVSFIKIYKLIKIKKTVFYCDRSNIIIAALLKIFTASPVIIRILGVYPDQKQLAVTKKAKIFSPFLFLAYKISYNYAICTQDGSGVEFYVDKLLNQRTQCKILLNGVIKHKTIASQSSCEKKVLLFVGKLIEEKGVPELIDAICNLKKKRSNFVLNIVGKGHLEEKINDIILEKGMRDHIKLIGSIRQNEINKYYQNADIYISLNKLGNLSNTVLEAMSMNKCIIMLQKDEKTYTDVYTEKLIPKNTVIRINRKSIVQDLEEKLESMISDSQLIDQYSKRMGTFADKFLWTWKERIDYEVNLLKQV